MPIRGGCRAGVAARRYGHDSGQATPDGVIVAAAFTVVLVSVTGEETMICEILREVYINMQENDGRVPTIMQWRIQTVIEILSSGSK